MSGLQCWNCGVTLHDLPLPMSRQATCEACFNELHCCLMCRFYAPGQPQQCDEDRAEPPLQKDNANFCEFFLPRTGAYRSGNNDRRRTAKDQLDALFTPPSDATGAQASATGAACDDEPDTGASAAEQARRKLDDLFK